MNNLKNFLAPDINKMLIFKLSMLSSSFNFFAPQQLSKRSSFAGSYHLGLRVGMFEISLRQSSAIMEEILNTLASFGTNVMLDLPSSNPDENL